MERHKALVAACDICKRKTGALRDFFKKKDITSNNRQKCLLENMWQHVVVWGFLSTFKTGKGYKPKMPQVLFMLVANDIRHDIE